MLENVNQQPCNYRTQTQFCQRSVLADGQVGLIWLCLQHIAFCSLGERMSIRFYGSGSLWSFPYMTCHSCWNPVRVAVSLLSATGALTGPCSFWTGLVGPSSLTMEPVCMLPRRRPAVFLRPVLTCLWEGQVKLFLMTVHFWQSIYN